MPPKKKVASKSAKKIVQTPVDDRFKKFKSAPYNPEPASIKSFKGPRNNRSVYPFIRGAITANADYNPIVQSLQGQKLVFDPNGVVPLRPLNFDEFGKQGDGRLRDPQGDVIMRPEEPPNMTDSSTDPENPFNEPRPIPTMGDQDMNVARTLDTSERSAEDLMQQMQRVPAQEVPTSQPTEVTRMPQQPVPETPRGLVESDNDDFDSDDEEPLQPLNFSRVQPDRETYQQYQQPDELPRAPVDTSAGPSGTAQDLPQPGEAFVDAAGTRQQQTMHVPPPESGDLLPSNLPSNVLDDILSRRSYVENEQTGTGTRMTVPRRPAQLPQRRGAEFDERPYRRIVRPRHDPIVPANLTSSPSTTQFMPEATNFNMGLSDEAYDALRRRQQLATGVASRPAVNPDDLSSLLRARADREVANMREASNHTVTAVARRRNANSYTQMEQDRASKRQRGEAPFSLDATFNVGSYTPTLDIGTPRRQPRQRTFGPLPDLPSIVPNDVTNRLANKRKERPVPRGHAQYGDMRGPALKKRADEDGLLMDEWFSNYLDITRRPRN